LAYVFFRQQQLKKEAEIIGLELKETKSKLKLERKLRNSELKALMLNYIAQWADSVWFHIGKDNIRSRRAVEKLGAILSHEEPKEVNRISFVQVFYKLKLADSFSKG